MNREFKKSLPKKIVRNSLSAKITVIVFWGLVIGGGLATAVLLRNTQESFLDRYESNADRMAFSIFQLAHETNSSTLSSLEEPVKRLMEDIDIAGLRISYGEERLVLGEIQPDSTVSERSILIALGSGMASEDDIVHISVHHKNLAQAVSATRKLYLMVMGISLLIFGLFMAWILRKILTRPFESMVATAYALSRGDLEARFNQTKNDEFGYLSKFFNHTLDKMVSQHEELQQTLRRAVQSESALVREKEMAEVTLHSIADGVIRMDEEARILYVNPVAQKLLDRTADDTIGVHSIEALHIVNESTEEELDPVAECLSLKRAIDKKDSAILITAHDQQIPVDYNLAPILDHKGQITGTVMVIRDVQEQRKLSRQLAYQAAHDGLTGLINRNEFNLQLKSLVEDLRGTSGKSHALGYIDLDHFKIVNDVGGHKAGDELLKQLSSTLKNHIRDTDIIARLGGDEFGLLLKYCSLAQAERLAYKICDVVHDFSFLWNGNSFQVSASIGIVPVTPETENVAELLSSADVACYTVKDGGGNHVHIYEQDDQDLSKRRGEMQWVSLIRQALNEHRFVLHCQRIQSLTGFQQEDNFYEILVRMVDSAGNIVLPMSFIPAAERYNLMSEVDRWVVVSTLKTISENRVALGGVSFSINLSGQSLCNPEFLTFLLSSFQEFQVSPDRICFEITETAAIRNISSAKEFITAVRQTGSRFLLDDFGTGVSSFGYLRNLDVDYIKIDGSFISGIDDPINRALVKSINEIGQSMGLKTVAEYVENDAILEVVRGMAINFAQGYGIEKPQPLTNLIGRRQVVYLNSNLMIEGDPQPGI